MRALASHRPPGCAFSNHNAERCATFSGLCLLKPQRGALRDVLRAVPTQTTTRSVMRRSPGCAFSNHNAERCATFSGLCLLKPQRGALCDDGANHATKRHRKHKPSRKHLKPRSAPHSCNSCHSWSNRPRPYSSTRNHYLRRLLQSLYKTGYHGERRATESTTKTQPSIGLERRRVHDFIDDQRPSAC